jgi:predicted amidohydrolase
MSPLPRAPDGDASLAMAVCELPDGLTPGDAAWQRLVALVGTHRPQALLLNELPFGAWPAAAPRFSLLEAGQAAAAHAAGVAALDAVEVPALFGSTALPAPDGLINEGFARIGTRYHALHHKLCLPEEAGFHENTWFRPGHQTFGLLDHAGFRFAFAICSELMVPEVGRSLVRAGADVLLVPRASTADGLDRWIAVARATAIVNGCYVLSSNRSGGGGAVPAFGGSGFAVAPGGEVLALTRPDDPLVVVNLSRDSLAGARAQYPLTISAHLDLPSPRPR